MPLATLLGDGHPDLLNIGFAGQKLKPENVTLIAIRDIDTVEKEMLKKSGINFYTMRDIDERGMFSIMGEAIEKTTAKTAGIHLSFDIDAIDPVFAPGVSTPVPGGLSFREAHLLLEMIAESGKLTSLDFVELNPLQIKIQLLLTYRRSYLIGFRKVDRLIFDKKKTSNDILLVFFFCLIDIFYRDDCCHR